MQPNDKRPTISAATILCMRVINSAITKGIHTANDLAELLSDPSEYNSGLIQGVSFRIESPVWISCLDTDDNRADNLHDSVMGGTTAEALIRLVCNVYGMNVAADIAPYLLDPSLISDNWN